MIDYIWKTHNTPLFIDKAMAPDLCASKIIALAKEHRTEQKSLLQHVPSMPELIMLFHGGSLMEPVKVTCLVVELAWTFILIRHISSTVDTPVRGSNNKVEFSGLCLLLEIAKSKNINRIQVLGDSKLVIDWANGRATVQNIGLVPIMQEIRQLASSFEWITYCHILRELNKESDALSKEALDIPSGLSGIYEFSNGQLLDAMDFHM